MRLLRRKQQREILDKLLRMHSVLEHESLLEMDDEVRKRYIEALKAISEIADAVTGSDVEMYTEFARKIITQTQTR